MSTKKHYSNHHFTRRVSEYTALARLASQAEKDKRWKEAYHYWTLAQKELSPHHVNYFWAENRAQFCYYRCPASPFY
ncbi:MAG: ANR family transcriptional regulator [Vibrio fluvialis]